MDERTFRWQVGHLTDFKLDDPIIEDAGYPSKALKLAEELSLEHGDQPYAVWEIDEDECYLPNLTYIVSGNEVFKKHTAG